MKAILIIIIIITGGYSDPVSVATQEFDSYESCSAAASKLNSLSGKADAFSSNKKITAFCQGK